MRPMAQIAPASRDPRAERLVRRDIVAEHLDEAAFLSTQWELALGDAEYTLEDVAEGPEARLGAHLDGLFLGLELGAGDPIVEGLGSDEPGVPFAAALALLDAAGGAHAAPVLAALREAEDAEQAAPLLRALQLCSRADVAVHLAPLLAQPAGPLRAGALDAFTFQRIDPGARLDPLLASDDTAVVEAALRAARWFPHRASVQLVERALVHDEPAVRDAAIETGILLGSKVALARCEEVVRSDEDGWRRSALLWGLSGEPDLQPLIAALEDAERRADAILALGFSGRAQVIDALLRWADDEALAPLVGEALTGIAGVPIAGPLAVEPAAFDPEDPDAQPELPDLPVPDAAAVRAWWEKSRKGFEGDRRFIAGQPWTAEALARAFESGSMRRRAVLAVDLAIRTRGAVLLETQDFATRQQEDWVRLRGAAVQASASTFRSILQYPSSQRPPPAARVAAATR